MIPRTFLEAKKTNFVDSSHLVFELLFVISLLTKKCNEN